MSNMNRDKIGDAACAPALAIIWEYMLKCDPLSKADIILCLGSNDVAVARLGADLWQRGYASTIVMSGGIAHTNDLAATGWENAEAVVYSEIALQMGIPHSAILVEDKASNTGENFTFSRKLYEERTGTSLKKAIIVAKPYMTRRGAATGAVVWPDVEILAYGETLDAFTYLDRWPEPTTVINLIVGDLQRIFLYPKLGFQIQQDIPEEVIHSYNTLVKLGFDKHLTNKHSIKID